MAVIFDEGGTQPGTDEGGGQVLDEAAGFVNPISIYPITVKVELLINGTWTDISRYVYQRVPIQITGGRSQEGDTPNPAQAVLTVNNRDGSFSPLYTGGQFYPFLTRNVQIRISAAAISTTGNHYSGYRFWGEVSRWPPLADLTGQDVYVQITASGPLRKIRQGGGKGSALTRYYASLAGSFAPIAYWPCEEDPFTTLIGPGTQGGTSMTVTAGTPTWKAISNFNGSGPIGVINGSTWDGLTGSFGSSGDDVFTTPGTYTWTASTSTVDARCWGGGGGSAGNNDGNAPGGASGGGEFAKEAALAVTIGNNYTVIVGAGGQAGSSGCVDLLTEICTQRGWLTYDQVQPGDRAMSVNLETGIMEFCEIGKVGTHEGQFHMTRLEGPGLSACVTIEHRWLIMVHNGIAVR